MKQKKITSHKPGERHDRPVVPETWFYPPLLTFISTHRLLYILLCLVMAAGLSVGLTACGDDEPLPDTPVVPTPEPEPEPEPEPTPGDTSRVRTLAIIADWREALAEGTIPAIYNLWIGAERHTADARNIYRYTDSLSAGPYALVAYNEPVGITITDSIASIDRTAAGLLTALPGYLFAADSTVAVAAGDTARVTLAMRRLVVPITLRLDFSEPARVAEANATLSGMTAAITLPDGLPVDSGTVALAIDTIAGGKGLVMRLATFGANPDGAQRLEVSVTLADGRTLTFRSDLTGRLEGLEPIALRNTLDTAKPDEPDEPDEPDNPDTPDPEPEPEPEPEPDPNPDPDPDVPVGNIDVEVGDWVEGDGNDITGEAKPINNENP